MVKKVDPNEGLAADAVLAEDLGDEETRRTEQLAYLGGDDDDIDLDENADRGDNIPEETDSEDRGDDVDGDADKSEEASDGDEEVSGDGEEESGEESGDVEDAGDDEDEAADDSDSEDPEDDEEDGESDEDVEDDEEPKKEKGIPRRRFNEVNARMRDAEAKLAAIQAEKAAGEAAAVEKFDFDAAEDEYMALLLDGKTKEAGTKRREIREAEKADFKAEAKAETLEDVDESAIERAVDSLTSEAEKMFPAFDQNSEEFNEAAVSKTLTFMRGYQTQGMRADDAFVAALADAIEIFGLDTESLNDEVPEKGGKKVTKKPPIKKTKEKIAASKRQGKTPAGEGKGSADVGAAVVDVDKLSEEELDALPATQLARLRGDFI